MPQHPHDEILLVYADDAAACRERSAVEDHLTGCPWCEQRLAAMREQLSEPHGGARQQLDRILEFERLIQAEELAAAPVIRRLTERVPADATIKLPELQSTGALRALIKAIPEVRRSRPSDALRLADAGLAAADEIPADHYSDDTLRYLRGMLYREQASSLRDVGRFDEALTALDYAEDQLARNTVAEFDLAWVWYTRAAVLREIDDLDQALLWTCEAADTYRRFGDVRMQNRAEWMHGAILFRQARFTEAARVFETLLPRCEEDGDDETLAATLSGLGQSEAEIGKLESGEKHLQRSARIYELLGSEVDKLKVKWAFARLLMKSGRFEQSISSLRQIQAALDNLELEDDVALIGLDLAEALLAVSKPAEAAAVCEEVMDSLRRGRSPVNVLRAVEYLREATSQRRATESLAREVRRFVEHAARMPQEKFQPPA